jgi:hypothetical protein
MSNVEDRIGLEQLAVLTQDHSALLEANGTLTASLLEELLILLSILL